MAKKYPRNRPCPCGSGGKYKNCCYGKDFNWVREDDGSVAREVPMSDEVVKGLSALGLEDRNENDFVFGGPAQLKQMEREMADTMRRAGIHPAKIYAFEKTGIMLSQENIDKVPDRDIEEWEKAHQEYFELHGEEPDGEHQEQAEIPIGTVAYYGPDDKTTTKIAASVITHEDAEPIMKRWVSSDVATSPKVQRELKNFFMKHGVKQVAMSEGNMGCPHEEGLDFPDGQECPFCEFWRGKQGIVVNDDPPLE